MDISVKALEEAVSIRRQIDNLERRLSSILGGAPARPAVTAPAQKARYFSPSTRAKLSSAARARWARLKGGAKPAPTKKKGALTAAGRRKLSELMKARWAARRRSGATRASGGTKAAASAKKGGLTAAGRRRLSQLMKARWAARRRATTSSPSVWRYSFPISSRSKRGWSKIGARNECPSPNTSLIFPANAATT